MAKLSETLGASVSVGFLIKTGDETRGAFEKKDFIKQCLTELLKDRQFLSVLRETIAGEVERVCHKFGEMAAQISELTNVNIELSEKCENLSKRCDAVEQYSRRKNIRITGVKTCQREDVEDTVVKILEDQLQLDVDKSAIAQCYPIGNFKDGTQSVLVRFVGSHYQQKVFRGRFKLKGSYL